MLIKAADDKATDIDVLHALLDHHNLNPTIKRRIQDEIRTMQAGLKGEKVAAYEIDFYFQSSRNWAVIHDLRIEHDGRVAQIDHLLFNRLLEIYVCESKNFSEGISINEQGEFSAHYDGRLRGIPSPIEQNRKHIDVLRSVFDDGRVKLPSRLGITLKPNLKSLILVSKGARISRPDARINGLDTIIKVDQLRAQIDADFEGKSPLLVVKAVSSETVEHLAEQVAALHQPIAFDWEAKFGLRKRAPPPAMKSEPVANAEANQSSPASPPPSANADDKPKSKLVCAHCGVSVFYSVAKFCWFNKLRFGGKVYCMDCQKTVGQIQAIASTAAAPAEDKKSVQKPLGKGIVNLMEPRGD